MSAGTSNCWNQSPTRQGPAMLANFSRKRSAIQCTAGVLLLVGFASAAVADKPRTVAPGRGRSAAPAARWGTHRGKIVFRGNVPKLARSTTPRASGNLERHGPRMTARGRNSISLSVTISAATTGSSTFRRQAKRCCSTTTMLGSSTLSTRLFRRLPIILCNQLRNGTRTKSLAEAPAEAGPPNKRLNVSGGSRRN